LKSCPFENLELDRTQARRLRLLEKIAAPTPRPETLGQGQSVPEFSFIDQSHQRISLSQLSGKVVAVTFIYTRCPFPNYCFRLSNNFGQLQKRFGNRMGKDLVLLSVVIDPANDQPDAMANYARTWKADSRSWHFLTGQLTDIEKLAHEFDMDFYPDEALYIHSFHTVLIDRRGRLAANLEGNDFTSKQLGDLVESMLSGTQLAAVRHLRQSFTEVMKHCTEGVSISDCILHVLKITDFTGPPASPSFGLSACC
jgi:protein SCO1/2